MQHLRNYDSAGKVSRAPPRRGEGRQQCDDGGCAVADEPEDRRGLVSRLPPTVCDVKARSHRVAGVEVDRLVWSRRLDDRPP